MSALQGPKFIPENSSIDSLVVLLHGYGADGQDLIDLAPFFAQHLPNTAFHSPDGPETCEMSPFGRQWFSLARCDADFLRRNSETQDIAFETMYEGACESAPSVNEYIHSLMAEYQLTAKQVCLVGFSQGTMMALHIGARQTESFASIVGFSGALVGTSNIAKETTSKCPVLLIHGEADEMLPVHAVTLAENGLRSAGFTPKIITRPALPHSIDQEGAIAAAAFLKNHLYP